MLGESDILAFLLLLFSLFFTRNSLCSGIWGADFSHVLEILRISRCFLPIIVCHESGFALEEGVVLPPYQSATDQVSFLGYSFIFTPLQKQKQQAPC